MNRQLKRPGFAVGACLALHAWGFAQDAAPLNAGEAAWDKAGCRRGDPGTGGLFDGKNRRKVGRARIERALRVAGLLEADQP